MSTMKKDDSENKAARDIKAQSSQGKGASLEKGAPQKKEASAREEDILAYDDAELSEEERKELGQLLEQNVDAAEDLSDWREIESLLKSYEDPQPSEDFVRAVMKNLATEAEAPWWKSLFLPEWFFSGGLCASALASWLLITPYLGDSGYRMETVEGDDVLASTIIDVTPTDSFLFESDSNPLQAVFNNDGNI